MNKSKGNGNNQTKTIHKNFSKKAHPRGWAPELRNQKEDVILISMSVIHGRLMPIYQNRTNDWNAHVEQ